MNDDHYRVPLEEFTAARDALSARLKAAGDKDAAAEVKRARKPNVPAWAANQVVWHAPERWERLRAAVADLRKAYENAASGEALRQATREQRDAQHAGEARAGELLAENGHAPHPALLQKVGQTLLALAYGAPGVTPGRLERELSPPGFEALAGLTLAAPEPPAAAPKSVPPRRDDRARARAIAQAEASERSSRSALQSARTALAALDKRRAALAAEVEAAEVEHREAEAVLRNLQADRDRG
jgi:hypothetical protein